MTDDFELVFDLQIEGKHVTVNLVEETDIGNNLTLEMMNQPGKYAKWATLCSLAENDRDNYQAKADLKYAELYKDAKDQNPKASETALKQAIIVDPEFKKLQAVLRLKEKNYNILKVLTKSIEQRKEMLQSLNASRRSEAENAY